MEQATSSNASADAGDSLNIGPTLVVQYGARRQYAVPAALAQAGALEALYTDACAGRGLMGRAASVLARGPAPMPVMKLAARRPPVDVLTKTRVFENWRRGVSRASLLSDPLQRVELTDLAHRRAGDAMIRAGFGNATHALVMLMEAQGFLTAARDRGLKTICDINVALSSEAIVSEEQRRHPGWAEPVVYWGRDLKGRSVDPFEETLTQTDLFWCPSDFVASDLVENFGVPAERVRLIPYDVNPSWIDLVNDPEPGRILFVGAADLRKGIHVLAEAQRLLAGRGRRYRFRIAGGVSATIRGRDETAGLEFLGHVPFTRMHEEFSRADVLTLPSIAEGSAGVTYEALGCGVPQVVTKAAGSIVRDGVEGLIVPERNPEALANAIEAIVEDRALRNTMATAARASARMFTAEGFSQRLLKGLFTKSSEPDGHARNKISG